MTSGEDADAYTGSADRRCRCPLCRSCMFVPGRIFSSLTLLVTGGVRKFLHRSKPEEDEPGENAKPGRAVCDRKLADPAPFRDASRTADGGDLPRDSPGSSHFHYPRLRNVQLSSR